MLKTNNLTKTKINFRLVYYQDYLDYALFLKITNYNFFLYLELKKIENASNFKVLASYKFFDKNYL